MNDLPGDGLVNVIESAIVEWWSMVVEVVEVVEVVLLVVEVLVVVEVVLLLSRCWWCE